MHVPSAPLFPLYSPQPAVQLGWYIVLDQMRQKRHFQPRAGRIGTLQKAARTVVALHCAYCTSKWFGRTQGGLRWPVTPRASSITVIGVHRRVWHRPEEIVSSDDQKRASGRWGTSVECKKPYVVRVKS